jgi:hypothetical protein
MDLPGDERLDRAGLDRRAGECGAPWLVQMGQDGGGLYSYETLENFAGLDYHNADPTELPSSAPPRQRR